MNIESSLENDLNTLISILLEEQSEKIKVPKNINSKFNLYRSLINIRLPKPITSEYITTENSFLQKLLSQNKITEISSLKTISKQYPNSKYKIRNINKISIYQGDITKLKIDIIVNAGNSEGLGCFNPCHNCIDNQIHTFSGINLRLECNEIIKKKKKINDGECIITNSYNLPCKKIITTCGPCILDNVSKEDKENLGKCYLNSLDLLVKEKLRSIAFPTISTGVFNFPKKDACDIALKNVDLFLDKYGDFVDLVVFCLHSDSSVELYEKMILE